ncbi:hypothetical protein J659_4221, partial [Acinetobacter baumannii 1406589]
MSITTLDLSGNFPFTQEVEFLLGGINQIVFEDDRVQFATQQMGIITHQYSPRLSANELELFCKKHIEEYKAINSQFAKQIENGEDFPLYPFWIDKVDM